MKITPQILYQRIKGSLSEALYLDLSGLGVGAIEGLEYCPKVECLDLSRNCLEDIENFECCKNLWRINLSDNKISCLRNLSKLFAVGTLDLSYNELTWNELLRIRHIFILNLRLHGNPALECDTYYRLHVIDCLPNVWVLDGRLITSAERLQVQQFFEDSALSNRPVRHKITEKSLLCDKSSKSAEIYGSRTYRFSSHFPINEPHTSETDKRRLEFLAYNIQEDLKNRKQSSRRHSSSIIDSSLQIIVEKRAEDREKCNMLLLLLIASIEFEFPLKLIEETLEITKLNSLFDTNTIQFFHLDPISRTEVISLLVSSCKLDREIDKTSSGGLYDRLYLCLYHSVAHLLKKTSKVRKKSFSDNSLTGNRPGTTNSLYRYVLDTKTLTPKRESTEWKAHQVLLASELILLLSVVPSFYQHILVNDRSVYKLLVLATGDHTLFERLTLWSQKLISEGDGRNLMCREICKSVARRMESESNCAVTGSDQLSTENGMASRGRRKSVHTSSQTDFILNTAEAYPKRPRSAVLKSGERLTSARRFQKSKDYINMVHSYDLQHLSLGSSVLLGAQNLAKVIALPEPHIALVQMDLIPALNGSVRVFANDQDEHYCYVDVRKLTFDHSIGCWKPRGSIGDKVTLQMDEELDIFSRAEQEIMKREREKYPSAMLSKNEIIYSAGFPSARPGFHSPIRSPMVTPINSINLTSRENSSSEKEPLLEFKNKMQPLSSSYCERMDLNLPDLKTNSAESPIAYLDEDQDSIVNFESITVKNQFSALAIPSSPSPASVNGNNEETISGDEDHWKMTSGSEENSSDVYLEKQQQESNLTEESSLDTEKLNEPNQALLEKGENDLNASENEKIEEKQEGIALESTVESDSLVMDVKEKEIDNLPSYDRDPSNENITEELEQQLQHAALEDKVLEFVEQEEKPVTDCVVEDNSNNIDAKSPNTAEEETERKKVLRSPRDDRFRIRGESLLLKQRPGEKKPRVNSAPDVKMKPKPALKNDPLSRPVSAVLTAKKVAFLRSHSEDSDSRSGSASSFQMMRTEAWRSSASSVSTGFPLSANDVAKYTQFVVDEGRFRKSPNVNLTIRSKRPPPQRPTSPDPSRFETQARLIEGSPLLTTSKIHPTSAPLAETRLEPAPTSRWLADGRDLYLEDLQNRQRNLRPRIPGYLDGLSHSANLMKKKKYISKACFGIDVLPSRPIKPVAMHPYTYHRRNNENQIPTHSSSLPLSNSITSWTRPRFSSYNELKQLSSLPGYLEKPFHW